MTDFGRDSLIDSSYATIILGSFQRTVLGIYCETAEVPRKSQLNCQEGTSVLMLFDVKIIFWI